MSHQKKKKKEQVDPNSRVVCRNRKASHLYDLLDDIECGLVLKGSEVKSVRNNKVSLEEAYARLRDGELWLMGCDIAEYPQANVMNHEPKRPRKLLLHKRELRKFAEAAEQQGFTLIPTSVYFKRGMVKVSVAVARGKKLYDKREKLKEQSARRDVRSALLKRG